jgi:hypothetical protein
MRATLKEMCEMLGAFQILGPYELVPWSASDATKGQTISAEVRMNPDGDELEAEIQIIHDTPQAGGASVEQFLWLCATPHVQDKWSVKTLRIKNEIWNNKVYNWEEKACNLFRATVTQIEQGFVPDMEEMIEKHIRSKERFGDQRGSGGGKSPKIKPAQLLDMKKGQGF